MSAQRVFFVAQCWLKNRHRSVPFQARTAYWESQKKMGEVRYLTHFFTQNLLVRYRASQLFEHFFKRWQLT